MGNSCGALYLTHFRYVWHHGCDSGMSTISGAFGPEAEPKAVYSPRTQEDVVVFMYHSKRGG